MRRTIIAILAIVLVFALLLGCTDGDEWGTWQGDVSERQRQPGQPGNVATVEAGRSGQ